MSDTLFEFWNTGENFGFTMEGNRQVAQSFTPSVTHSITSVKLVLYRVGTPVTNFLVRIYLASAGKPTGAALTSGSVDATGFLTSPGQLEEITVTPYTLSSGVQYVIVGDYPIDGGITIGWRGTFTQANYTGGSEMESSDYGSTWTIQSSQDTMFEEYGIADTSNPVDVTGTIAAVSTVSGAVDIAGMIDVTGTIAAVSTVSGALKGVLSVTGTIAAVSDVSGAVSIIKILSVTGTIAAVSTVSGLVAVFNMIGFPVPRPDYYDETELWDEETKTWYAATTPTGKQRLPQAGGRTKNFLVVLSDQGKVYFGEV